MSPFHLHLEECGRCGFNPSDLCPVGAELQSKTAAECKPQLLVIEQPKPYRKPGVTLTPNPMTWHSHVHDWVGDSVR